MLICPSQSDHPLAIQCACYVYHVMMTYDVYCAQIITGSHDCTVRLWDLAAGKSRVTLTNHKKSVRALAIHPTQYVNNG